MTSLALTCLTLTLGLFFILLGQFKITSKFFPDIHEDMKREFGRNNKVFPFYQLTKWRPYAKNYRMTIGIAEVVCGAVLVVIPGSPKQLANVILLLIMLGALYTHYALHDRLDRMGPGIVFSLLLFTRLIIYRQETRSSSNVREKLENEDGQESNIDKKEN